MNLVGGTPKTNMRSSAAVLNRDRLFKVKPKIGSPGTSNNRVIDRIRMKD